VRILGALQLFVGIFLALFMGTITANLLTELLNPGQLHGGSRFTGTSQEATLILGLFGIVIIFGLGSAFSGLWQIATGRRNRWIVLLVVGLGILLLLAANALNYSIS
jgi:hypothetical protein